MLWPENKTLVQLGGYGEAGANPARFRHRDAPARQSGLCAVLPPGAQSGYRAQLAYNAHGAMGCVQKVQHGTARRRVPCGAALCRPFAFSRGGRETFARHFAACKPSPPRQPSGLPRGLFCSLRRQWGRAARCRTGNLCAAAAFFRGALFKSACGPWAGPLFRGSFLRRPGFGKRVFCFAKNAPAHAFGRGCKKER